MSVFGARTRAAVATGSARGVRPDPDDRAVHLGRRDAAMTRSCERDADRVGAAARTRRCEDRGSWRATIRSAGATTTWRSDRASRRGDSSTTLHRSGLR